MPRDFIVSAPIGLGGHDDISTTSGASGGPASGRQEFRLNASRDCCRPYF
jgi:hypothetical protein